MPEKLWHRRKKLAYAVFPHWPQDHLSLQQEEDMISQKGIYQCNHPPFRKHKMSL